MNKEIGKLVSKVEKAQRVKIHFEGAPDEDALMTLCNICEHGLALSTIKKKLPTAVITAVPDEERRNKIVSMETLSIKEQTQGRPLLDVGIFGFRACIYKASPFRAAQKYVADKARRYDKETKKAAVKAAKQQEITVPVTSPVTA